MSKIFLDTNIILDVILPDRPSAEASRRVLSMGSEDCRLYLSCISVATLSCVLQKNLGKEQASEIIKEWYKRHYVLSVSDMSVYDALRSSCPDFEDAMQISCANSNNCDCIITNNVKHFRGHAPMQVFTPEEFVSGCRAAAKAKKK